MPSQLAAINYYVSEHFMYSDFICPCCDMLKLVPGFFKKSCEKCTGPDHQSGKTGISTLKRPIFSSSGERN
jgi:hypothetical protein